MRDVRASFVGSIESLKMKIARKFQVPASSLKKWRKLVVRNFTNKLMSCVHNVRYKVPVLLDVISRAELSRLQEKYVISVVDKAAGNFAFTCKKFYFLKLAAELGMDNPAPGNETYVHIQNSEDEIVRKIKQDLAVFRVVPEDSEQKLALLYQTPKFHKNPPKMRYIAGNVSTATSKLDGIVAKILKMCKGHFVNLCKKNEKFSGRRCVFDVQTSLEVKDMFDKASGQIGSISINDFSTLYTLFDHQHLLGNISWLIHKLAKNSGMQHVRIGKENAWWVLGSSEGIVFSLGEILEMIEYLVKNAYIKAFGSIFRQDRGIIMGGRCSGWLSDCSLMVDEFKFVERKIREGSFEIAEKLKFFRRYRDDCTSLDIGNFLQIASEIYPPSLTLSQENDQPDRANVLDMVVEIKEGSIYTKVYCKTDHFPFNVISFPFLDSNIDDKICYRVFYGQILRFQRLSSLKGDFEERAKYLADVLINRGYKVKLLQKQFCKVTEKYRAEFQKWLVPSNSVTWFNQIVSSS